MFDIEYKGGNAVILTTKTTKIVFDPKTSLVGIKDVSTSGAVEVVTEDRFAVKDTTNKLFFNGPGEYEVGDVSLVGIATRRHIDTEEQGLQSTIYTVEVGDIKCAVIGNIASKLDDDQLEEIGVVDLVIIPVGGGGYTLDATDSATIVRQIEPKAVVPIHYKDSGLKYEVPQESLDEFVKEMGSGVIEAGTKLKVKNVAGLPEQLTIIKVTRS